MRVDDMYDSRIIINFERNIKSYIFM